MNYLNGLWYVLLLRGMLAVGMASLGMLSELVADHKNLAPGP